MDKSKKHALSLVEWAEGRRLVKASQNQNLSPRMYPPAGGVDALIF